MSIEDYIASAFGIIILYTILSLVLNLIWKSLPFEDKITIKVHLKKNYKKYKDNTTPIYIIKKFDNEDRYFIKKFELEWVNSGFCGSLLLLIPIEFYKWEYRYKEYIDLPESFNLLLYEGKDLSIIYQEYKNIELERLANIKEPKEKIIERELNKVWEENYFDDDKDLG